MRPKKAVLISCFNYYDIRLKHVENYLKDNQYDVTYITSDFDHIAKEPYKIERAGAVQVHARTYKKNLSFQRLFSHFSWASDVFKKVNEIRPDLLFVMLPPNSLARHAAIYRKKNDVKLIFDIYDLWPETYPQANKPLLALPFYFWRRMRDKYLWHADLVTFECEFFRRLLSCPQNCAKRAVLYPAYETSFMRHDVDIVDEDEMHLAYLGSINNIVDIPEINSIISEILKYKAVIVHVIGTGESKNLLVESLGNTGARVHDHGVIYDQRLKHEILSRCSFGLNIMKTSVCIGLTMKSIDFLMSGLPIINNIKGDTWQLVEEYSIGVNYDNTDLAIMRIVNHNCASPDRIIELYNNLFSREAFLKRLDELLSGIVSK